MRSREEKKNLSQPNSQIRYSLKGDLLLPLKIFGSSHCNNTVIYIILQATSEFPSNYRYWEFGFACSILCRLVIKGEKREGMNPDEDLHIQGSHFIVKITDNESRF